MDIVTSYLPFVTGPSSIHYGILLCIVYLTCSRMIVLYFWYRVNRGTNLLSIFVYVILSLFLLPLRMGLVLGVSQHVGRSPPCIPLHNRRIPRPSDPWLVPINPLVERDLGWFRYIDLSTRGNHCLRLQ